MNVTATITVDADDDAVVTNSVTSGGLTQSLVAGIEDSNEVPPGSTVYGFVEKLIHVVGRYFYRNTKY